MDVDVQWTVDPPAPFQTVRAVDWPGLPRKPEPGGVVVIDNVRGWIARLNVQGIDFRADHYHVEQLPGRVIVTLRHDGGPGVFGWADVWTLQRAFGRRTHTLPTGRLVCDGPIQRRTVYLRAADTQRHALYDENWTSESRVIVRPLAAFTPPPAAEVIHGVTVPQGIWTQLLAFPMQHYNHWRP